MDHEGPYASVPRNRLLAALPQEDLARMLPKFRRIELTLHQVHFPAGGRITSVIFPETGWFSLLVVLKDGSAGEVGLIGREGMVGLPLLLGDDQSYPECLVQGSGTALSLNADVFRQELDRSPALGARVGRWTLAYTAQLAQTATCNSRHHIKQRLARWLLMTGDRAEGASFPMTHELLSKMLGVRRASITMAARSLKRAGFIRYERGWVEITDRPGLKAASCECYGTVRREFDRLLGADTGRGAT
jgi:CRP-like cAMP-binding protein